MWYKAAETVFNINQAFHQETINRAQHWFPKKEEIRASWIWADASAINDHQLMIESNPYKTKEFAKELNINHLTFAQYFHQTGRKTSSKIQVDVAQSEQKRMCY